jgi:PmbA protein
LDEALLHDVIASALRAGADAAEAVAVQRRALSVSSREGALEEVEREESRDLGVRVFVGRRQASVSGSDLSEPARARLIERVVAMARLAPEDPYTGFAPEERLARGPAPDLDLYDPAEPSAEALEAAAAEADAAASAVQGVTNTDGASASWSSSDWRLVTSAGFLGGHRSSGFSRSASAIAGEGAGMERGGEGRTTRHLSDLPAAGEIGAEAGRRAAERLGPRKIESRTAAVMFENRVATSLLGPLVGAISGPAVARGASFLKHKLGEQVFAPGVIVRDEPLRLRGLGSASFDDEGVAVQTRDLIADGVLTTWLMNSAAARQLGLETTGHASRGLAGAPGVSVHNLTFLPGAQSPAQLMAQAGEGLLVTSMFGPSLNAHTGDWSAGVSGMWWENGAPAYPVNEITVAGNLLDIYARLIAADDLEIRGASNSPSLFVDALAIAGR